MYIKRKSIGENISYFINSELLNSNEKPCSLLWVHGFLVYSVYLIFIHSK
nr:MAG TPA: hypothetical protein [Caudoviricetes sp.]